MRYTSQARAERIARAARERGVRTARAVLDDRRGWICTVTVPGRDRIFLRDTYDITWLLTETQATSHTERVAIAA